MADRERDPEMVRRGLELQAQLPEPAGWGPSWLGPNRQRTRTDAQDAVEGTIEGAVNFGAWGLLAGLVAWFVAWLMRKGRGRPG